MLPNKSASTRVRNQVSIFVKSIPLTLLLFALILSLGVLTGGPARRSWPWLMQHFGWDLDALLQGRFYALWVGLFFASRPGVIPVMLGMLLVGVGTLEHHRGTRMALFSFFLVAPLVGILTALLMWPFALIWPGWVGPLLHHPDMGSSAAALASWGMVLGGIRGRRQGLLAAGTIASLVLAAVFVPGLYIEDFAAFLAGLGLGATFRTSPRNQAEVAQGD